MSVLTQPPENIPRRAGWAWRRFWHVRVRPTWRAIRPFVLLAITLLVLILGTIGFKWIPGASYSLLDAVYSTFQLYALGGGVPPGPPTELQVARFLAPLVVGYAAIRGVAALWREQIQLATFRVLLRNHVVVAGLGGIGFRLARAFSEAGARLVAIESDPGNPAIEGCHERGIAVLKGNATDPSVLSKVRVARARYLLSTCGEDATNIDVVAAARELTRGVHTWIRDSGKLAHRVPTHNTLSAFAQLDDRALWRLIKAQAVAEAGGHRFRLELFNVFETAARMVLEAHPPFPSAPPREGKAAPRVLVIAEGIFAEALVLHMARLWRNARGTKERLSVTLVLPGGDPAGRSLRDDFPTIERLLDLRIERFDLEGEELDTVRLTEEMTSVYIGVDDPRRGLAAALAIASRLDESRTPLVLALPDADSGVANAIPQRPPEEVEIKTFGVLSSTCTPALVLRGTTEIIARAQHASYSRALRARGVTPKEAPFLVSWDELPEAVKDKNRRFADHVGVKLEAIGCVTVPAALVDPSNPGFAFTSQELELLAEMEHERWCEDQRRDGTVYGPVRDETHHPSLIPWAELSEEEREKDRQAVRDLPAMLAQAGFRIYRA